jgi:hypothetical protein
MRLHFHLTTFLIAIVSPLRKQAAKWQIQPMDAATLVRNVVAPVSASRPLYLKPLR